MKRGDETVTVHIDLQKKKESKAEKSEKKNKGNMERFKTVSVSDGYLSMVHCVLQ